MAVNDASNSNQALSPASNVNFNAVTSATYVTATLGDVTVSKGNVLANQSTAATEAVTSVFHSDNTTGTSNSVVKSISGGASGGDAIFRSTIANVGDWAFGTDNSDNDSFCISRNPNVGNNNMIRLDPSFGGQYKGYLTDIAPSAGWLGQQIRDFQAPAAILLNNGTYVTVVSITLTPGVWDITGFVFINGDAGYNGTVINAGIATATNSNTGHVVGDNATDADGTTIVFNVCGMPLTFPNYRVLLAADTSYYLTVKHNSAGGTCHAGGRLSAVRVG